MVQELLGSLGGLRVEKSLDERRRVLEDGGEGLPGGGLITNPFRESLEDLGRALDPQVEKVLHEILLVFQVVREVVKFGSALVRGSGKLGETRYVNGGLGPAGGVLGLKLDTPEVRVGGVCLGNDASNLPLGVVLEAGGSATDENPVVRCKIDVRDIALLEPSCSASGLVPFMRGVDAAGAELRGRVQLGEVRRENVVDAVVHGEPARFSVGFVEDRGNGVAPWKTREELDGREASE